MHPALQAVLALCAVALTAALVAALLAVRRAAVRADRVLGILEQELRPIIAQVHATTEDLRSLTQLVNGELRRVGTILGRVDDVSRGAMRLIGALSAFSRAGQLVGVALGIRKGIDVFVHRLRGDGGGSHG
jgi:hypothetical protein